MSTERTIEFNKPLSLEEITDLVMRVNRVVRYQQPQTIVAGQGTFLYLPPDVTLYPEQGWFDPVRPGQAVPRYAKIVVQCLDPEDSEEAPTPAQLRATATASALQEAAKLAYARQS